MNDNKVIMVLFSALILLFSTSPVYSEDSTGEFQIKPILPDTQLSHVTYYHFKGELNETVTLQAEVINHSNEPLEILLQSFNAYSGKQGILYQDDPILEGTEITDGNYQFEKYVIYPKEVNLAPLESKVVEFTVEIPDIKGTLLGSMQFRILKGTQELNQDDESNSQLLIDQYKAYNIGVQIEVSETQETHTLNLDKPYFSSENITAMVPFENPHPAIVPDITGSYTITMQEDETFLVEGEVPKFKMAPLSRFDYPYRWGNVTLRPGAYTITSHINVDGHEQVFEQELTIENQAVIEAADNQNGDTVIEPNSFPWMSLVIAVLSLVIIVLLFILLQNRRNASPKE